MTRRIYSELKDVKRENQIVYYILYIRFRCQKNIEIQGRDICFSSFCISELQVTVPVH